MSTAGERRPFWRRKTLAEMSPAEWESLCDGCGRCCVEKIETPSGDVVATGLACRLLDTSSCRCLEYASRRRLVPQCIALRPSLVAQFDWLPATCAYRLIEQGSDLPSWHPLVSGDPESVHRAGISMRGRVVSAREVASVRDDEPSRPSRRGRGLARRRANAGATRR